MKLASMFRSTFIARPAGRLVHPNFLCGLETAPILIDSEQIQSISLKFRRAASESENVEIVGVHQGWHQGWGTRDGEHQGWG